MKKILLIIMLILLYGTKVNAKEIFYTNDYNVSFSKEEYEFISNFIFDGYQKTMNQLEFDEMFSDINANYEINSVQYESKPPLMTTSNSVHETASKILTLKSSCNEVNCRISIINNWKKAPVIRSYDVIGARIENIPLPTSIITKLQSGTKETDIYEKQNFKNGFGVSVKLPSENNNIIITQTFSVEKGGRVYASYQHAKSNVTLSESKKYTISSSGYGGVFQFDSFVRDKYDKMQGVYIDV